MTTCSCARPRCLRTPRFCVATIMCRTYRLRRIAAVSHRLAHFLKVLDRYQSSRACQRIACFIPVRVLFSAHHMQEVAGREGEVVRRLGGCGVVVERLDDLQTVSFVRRCLEQPGLTFLGGSMAIASFCGMEICTGFAESCFESPFMDRRNCRIISNLVACQYNAGKFPHLHVRCDRPRRLACPTTVVLPRLRCSRVVRLYRSIGGAGRRNVACGELEQCLRRQTKQVPQIAAGRELHGRRQYSIYVDAQIRRDDSRARARGV